MLDNIILLTMKDLITQRYDDCVAEKSRKIKELINNDNSGFCSPSGYIYSGILELDKNFIKKISEIIWQATIETLNAYNPKYYREIATDIELFLNNYLSERLTEPRDFLGSLGIPNPEFRNKEIEKYELENSRRFSIFRLKTNIELYFAKMKHENEKNMSNKNTINIGSVQNSTLQIDSPYATQTLNVTEANSADLKNLVEELKKAVDSFQLSQEQFSELKDAITVLEIQANSAKPNNVIIKESGRTVRNILEGTTGSIIASGLIYQLGLFVN